MTSILFLIETIYSKHFQIQLFQKRKIFFKFFVAFGKLDSILNIFQKNMTLIAYLFFNLRSRKNVVR